MIVLVEIKDIRINIFPWNLTEVSIFFSLFSVFLKLSVNNCHTCQTPASVKKHYMEQHHENDQAILSKWDEKILSSWEWNFPSVSKAITAINGPPCGFCELIEDLTFSETCKSLKPVWKKNLLTSRKSATLQATTWTQENASCYTIN